MPDWQSRTALNKGASQNLFFFSSLLLLPDAFLYPISLTLPWPVRSGPLPETPRQIVDSMTPLSGDYLVALMQSSTHMYNISITIAIVKQAPYSFSPNAASTMSTVKERQLKAIMRVCRANYDRSRGGGYATSEGVFENF